MGAIYRTLFYPMTHASTNNAQPSRATPSAGVRPARDPNTRNDGTPRSTLISGNPGRTLGSPEGRLVRRAAPNFNGKTDILLGHHRHCLLYKTIAKPDTASSQVGAIHGRYTCCAVSGGSST